VGAHQPLMGWPPRSGRGIKGYNRPLGLLGKRSIQQRGVRNRSLPPKTRSKRYGGCPTRSTILVAGKLRAIYLILVTSSSSSGGDRRKLTAACIQRHASSSTSSQRRMAPCHQQSSSLPSTLAVALSPGPVELDRRGPGRAC